MSATPSDPPLVPPQWPWGLPADGLRAFGVESSLLETILDTLPNPVMYKDVSGRILGCNLAFEAVMDISRGEVSGKTPFDLLPRAEAEFLRGKDAELLEKGGIMVYPCTVTLPGQGLRQIMVYKAPFKRPDGSIAGVVASIMDITDQVAAEEALRQSEQLFTTITQHVVDLMAIIDADGRRVYCSPSYEVVLGYSPQEMERTASLGLLHPDDHDRVEAVMATLFRGEPAQALEYRLRHRDGRWLCFEAKCSLITHPSGSVPQVLVVARDVTSRKEAEAARHLMEKQLQQAQRLESIGSLAAGIAHEINTPTQYIGDNAAFLRDALRDVLTFVSGQRKFLELLAGGEAGSDLRVEVDQALAAFRDLDLDYLSEEIPRALQQSLDGVGQVSRIVSAMKDFSHPGEATKAPADLNRAIESTLAVSRNEWKYVAELEVDLDPELPPVPCFLGEFNQAILNLVVNAAHAVGERLRASKGEGRGHIRIATRRVGAEVEVVIGDDGAGIPEAIRGRVFDPFFTTKPVGKGTGQGLAIVHAVVVERHGGRLSLESEVGRGTTFHVWLPLGDPGEQGSADGGLHP